VVAVSSATRGRRPEQVVTINGAEYAWLYRVPPQSADSAAGTEFGPVRLDRFYLRSEDRRYLKSDELIAGDTVLLTLRWSVVQPVDRDYFATVSILDSLGHTVAENVERIGAPDESTRSVRVGDFVTELHRVPLPANLLGDFQVAISVRPDPTGTPLSVSGWPERLSEGQRRPTQVIVETIRTKPAPPVS
jgi:hypothetical protein